MVRWDNSLYWNYVLASWTGELTEEEADLQLLDQLPGAGVVNRSMIRMYHRAFDSALLREVVLRSFSSNEYGKAFSRKAALRQCTLRDYFLHKMHIFLHEYFRLSVLQDVEMTSQLEAIVFQSCAEFIDAIAAGRLDVENDLRLFLSALAGMARFDADGWQELLGKLDTEQTAAFVAFCMAQKYRLNGMTNAAEFLYQKSLEYAHADPLMRDLVRGKLDQMLRDKDQETLPGAASRPPILSPSPPRAAHAVSLPEPSGGSA
jgi:hypothetical protein